MLFDGMMLYYSGFAPSLAEPDVAARRKASRCGWRLAIGRLIEMRTDSAVEHGAAIDRQMARRSCR